MDEKIVSVTPCLRCGFLTANLGRICIGCIGRLQPLKRPTVSAVVDAPPYRGPRVRRVIGSSAQRCGGGVRKLPKGYGRDT